jgi:uncharacterized LabA/DUF88 family protein
MREVQPRLDRLAVLIDADNTSHELIEPLLKEVAKYGNAHVKRIYGDWTNQNLVGWKEKLNEFAIQPMQQFAYTRGKNSTDSALIIDAMDLLYTRNFDGFCIISSDSDFTRLASRIRESGLVVYGFGKRKTPKSFIGACDKFIYTEILKEPEETGAISAGSIASALKKSVEDVIETQKITHNQQLIQLLKEAYDILAAEDEDGWIELGLFGHRLTRLSPDFDPRNYGYKQLKKLIKAVEIFDIREAPHEKNPVNRVTQIKLKG